MEQACSITVWVLFGHSEFEITCKAAPLLDFQGTRHKHGAQTYMQYGQGERKKNNQKYVKFVLANYIVVKLGEKQGSIAVGAAAFAFTYKVSKSLVTGRFTWGSSHCFSVLSLRSNRHIEL